MSWQDKAELAVIEIIGSAELESFDTAYGVVKQAGHLINKGNLRDLSQFSEYWFRAIGATIWPLIKNMSPAEMALMLARKQHDYGPGNILAFGIVGVWVRISDKFERYLNLAGKTNKVPGEVIEDTLLDIVGYCVIGWMLIDNTFTVPLDLAKL